MNIVKIHDDLNNKSPTHNSLIKPVVATLGYNGIVPFYPPWVPLLPEQTHSSSLPRWKKDLSLWLNSGFQCGIWQHSKTRETQPTKPIYLLFIYGFICFETKVSLVAPRWTWNYCVPQDGLELLSILLCQPPRCWDHVTYKHACLRVCMCIYMNSVYSMRNFRNSEVMLGCFLVWMISWPFLKKTS